MVIQDLGEKGEGWLTKTEQLSAGNRWFFEPCVEHTSTPPFPTWFRTTQWHYDNPPQYSRKPKVTWWYHRRTCPILPPLMVLPVCFLHGKVFKNSQTIWRCMGGHILYLCKISRSIFISFERYEKDILH